MTRPKKKTAPDSETDETREDELRRRLSSKKTRDFEHEHLSHPTGSTLASQPECLWCSNLFWTGDLAVVVSGKKLAHYDCFNKNASSDLVRHVGMNQVMG